MAARDPIRRDDESMTSNGFARSAEPFADAQTDESAVGFAPVRPLGGRRINFLAWGLAGVTGLVLWAIIIKLA
jgi:hypothetical protein